MQEVDIVLTHELCFFQGPLRKRVLEFYELTRTILFICM